MRNSFLTARYLGSALFALCITLAFAGGVNADDGGKEFKGEHPLRVLKARFQNDGPNGANLTSARGNLTIWLQNITSVIVDGIDIEVQLYNNNKRQVDTLHRSVEKLEPGEKKVLTFRWDVVAESEVTPKFFVEYNSRGTQKARFEGAPATWN